MLEATFRTPMPRDFLKNAKSHYDVVVIGSGLAGLTVANTLARQGRSRAAARTALQARRAWRRGSSDRAGIFSTSRCTAFRSAWSRAAGAIGRGKSPTRSCSSEHIRFDNPMFSLTTTFNREDFTELLVEEFDVEPETVNEFFDTARGDELLRRSRQRRRGSFSTVSSPAART